MEMVTPYRVINLKVGKVLSLHSYMHHAYGLRLIFFLVLCLTFFVLKFHWFSFNSLSATSIWSKTIIYSFSLKSCLIFKTFFILNCFHFKLTWAIDFKLVSNERLCKYLWFETNQASVAQGIERWEEFQENLLWNSH